MAICDPAIYRDLNQRFRDRVDGHIAAAAAKFSPTHVFQDVTPLIAERPGQAFFFHHPDLGATPWFSNRDALLVAYLADDGALSAAGEHLLRERYRPGPASGRDDCAAGGGHVRVRLEDNLYYRQGELATNVQLIERVVRLVRGKGLEPATPAEAREIIGVPFQNAAARPAFAVG